jgi:hypothetical protein
MEREGPTPWENGNRAGKPAPGPSVGGKYVLVRVIAVGEHAGRRRAHRQVDAVAIAARATLRSWIGKDRETKYGIPLVAEEISSAAAERQADAERRCSRDAG